MENSGKKIKACLAVSLSILMVSNVIQPVFAEGLLSRDFSLPARLGSVTDSYSGPTASESFTPSVVLIEDLHGNRSVQHAISGILRSLDRQGWLPDRIASEGLSGPFDVSSMQAVKNSRLRRDLCNEMISEGNLYGEIGYVVTKGRGGIFGIENPEYYQASIDLVRASYDQRSLLNDQLIRLQSGLSVLQAQGQMDGPQSQTIRSDVQSLKAFVSGKVLPQELPEIAKNSEATWDRLKTVMPSLDQPKSFSAVSSMMDYYSLALLRDQAIFDNLSTLRTMDRQTTSVLVVGGFHVPGLMARLRAAGQSYIVITPTVAVDTKRDEDLYLARLLDRPLSPDNNASGANAREEYEDLRAPLFNVAASFVRRANVLKTGFAFSRLQVSVILLTPGLSTDAPTFGPNSDTVAYWIAGLAFGFSGLAIAGLFSYFIWIAPRTEAKAHKIYVDKFWAEHPEFSRDDLIKQYNATDVDRFATHFGAQDIERLLPRWGMPAVMRVLHENGHPDFWLNRIGDVTEHFGLDTMIEIKQTFGRQFWAIGQYIWSDAATQNFQKPSDLVDVKRIRQRFEDLIASAQPNMSMDLSATDMNEQDRHAYEKASAAFELIAPKVEALYKEFVERESKNGSSFGTPPKTLFPTRPLNPLNSSPATRALPSVFRIPLDFALYPVRLVFQEIPHMIALRSSGIEWVDIHLNWKTLNPSVEVFGADASQYPGASLAGITGTWAVFVGASLAAILMAATAPWWATGLVAAGGVTALIEGILTSIPHTVTHQNQVYTSDMQNFVDGLRTKLQNPNLFKGIAPLHRDIYTTWDAWFKPSVREQIAKTRAQLVIATNA